MYVTILYNEWMSEKHYRNFW